MAPDDQLPKTPVKRKSARSKSRRVPAPRPGEGSRPKNSESTGLFSRRSLKWLGMGAVSLFLILVLTIFAPGPLKFEKKVYFKEGTGLSEMATILHREGVIRWPTLFKLAVVVQGGQRRLRYGEYLFTPRVTAESIFWKMLRGKVVMYQLTVPEGMRSVDVLKLIKNEPILQGEIPDFLQEGSLLPETYDFSRGSNRADLVARMNNAMNTAVQDAWSNRASDLPYSNPRELVTMASIVERETPLASERPRVAGVYLNRLRMNMKLQADPTTAYAVGLKNPSVPFRKVLTLSDLAYNSPYNTYRVYGLPPGPIANPGIESIKAAANPIKTAELYFVATGHGGHAFATTLAQHNRNVTAWRQFLKQYRAKSIARKS
ncbi:MAG: endolytic transglycosylase MltG [Alphaproteobacteria bacterium]|nr:endolytic transglycosylase MltG [Alphaproteobacteria bacterium]